MSDIWIPYGGGADLDPVTAGAADIRKGKVIVDKNGNPLTGTMAEAAAKTYTPGTANQVIAAGQYLAGNQTILGDANLQPWNIKKGVTIFGRTGIFQGWVDWNYNIFLDGNTSGINYSGQYTNYVNIGSTISFQTNAQQSARKGISFGSPVSFSGYSKLIVRYLSDTVLTVGVVREGADIGSHEVSSSSRYSIDANTFEVALDIHNIARQPTVFIGTLNLYPGYTAGIYRIVLARPL